MTITVNIRYTGENGNARKFAEEMTKPSGKNYNRKKDKQEMRRADLRSGDGFEVSSFFVCFEIK